MLSEAKKYHLVPVVVVYVFVAAVAGFRFIKDLQDPQSTFLNVIVLLLAIATIIGCLLGDVYRKAVGSAWIWISLVGLVGLILSMLLQMQPLVITTLVMLIAGGITSLLIFAPEIRK